jgi:hypothetical protein
MAFWEFLLQKEGDRSWLPLESPQVEVLEGKYRVVARSSQTNTSVEIRIIHDATAEIPPVRRTQKRHGKTNREGLIVVMPFTRLLPGTWQLRCMSDVMSDLMGSGWEYALHLHVLPIEPDISDEWDSDWGEGVTAAEGGGLDPAADSSALSQSEPATVTESASGKPAFDELAQTQPDLNEAISASTSETFGALNNETAATHSLSDQPSDEQIPASEVGSASAQITSAGEASNLLPLAPRSTVDRPSPALQDAAQRSQEVVDSVFQALEGSTTASEPEPIANHISPDGIFSDGIFSDNSAPDDSAPDGSAPDGRSSGNSAPVLRSLPESLPLRLNLGQETYVAQRGQAVTLTGQVESIDELLTYELLPVESLEIRLYDPRTSRILVEKRQPLTARRLPFPFTCRITLPEHYQTYLVLGELVLYGAADGDVPPPVLAIQSFNVTTDLHELIEAIANDYTAVDDAEINFPLPPEAAPTSAERDRHANVSFPPSSQATVPEISFKASSQQPLPPQLHPAQPEPTDRPNRPLELPSFGQVTAIDGGLDPSDDSNLGAFAQGSPASDPASLLDSDLDEPIAADASESRDGELDQLWTDSTDAQNAAQDLHFSAALDRTEPDPQDTPAHTSPVSAFSAEPFNDEPISDWESADRDWNSDFVTTAEDGDAASDPPEPDSPERAAFRALNLQDRFWERLQSLVVDRDLSHWLEVLQEEEDGSSLEPADDETFPLGKLKRRPIGRDAQLAAQEVLADDELEPASTEVSGLSASNQPAMTLMLPIDEPVSVPELQAVSGELTAGQKLMITVKLPDSHPQVFVKLWLSERQSRSILDAPRWLTEFLPDGFGDLITRTELTVPHGCVEIQVEAIAVEMATQRESDKVTLVRKVIPADLSSYSLDELDV